MIFFKLSLKRCRDVFPSPGLRTIVSNSRNNVREETQSLPQSTITFNQQLFIDKYSFKTATVFYRQFSNIVVHTTDGATRKCKRRVKRTLPLDQSTNHFSRSTVLQTFKACKFSIVSGFDSLAMLHIKHLVPLGIKKPHRALQTVPTVC